MLYRRQTGPGPIWLVVGAALTSLLLGFLAGRLSAPQPSLQELLRPAALHLRQAEGALDIVSLEYARALSGNAQSQAASRRAMGQVQTELAGAGGLGQLFPQEMAEADRKVADVSQAVSRQAPQAGVEQQISGVRAALADLSARISR